MDKLKLRETLGKACAGQLHVLPEQSRRNISRHKRNMALTACLIGKETRPFAMPFIYINDHFTKTGSGQT